MRTGFGLSHWFVFSTTHGRLSKFLVRNPKDYPAPHQALFELPIGPTKWQV